LTEGLGPLRAALDGLAFCAYQAGANGETMLGDCSEVAEWIEAAMSRAAEAVADAARYRWLRDHPDFIVVYRQVGSDPGTRQWLMCHAGYAFGSWWPTHAQAVDYAMRSWAAPDKRSTAAQSDIAALFIAGQAKTRDTRS
jgi:hypothetical protein